MYRGWIFFLIIFIGSCSAIDQNKNIVSPQAPRESQKEVGSAMGAVVGSVTGKETSEEDLRKLDQQIRHDKKAQSAVESIAGAMSDPAAAGKYCPVDGERYSAKFEKCPKHDVLLKNIEE